MISENLGVGFNLVIFLSSERMLFWVLISTK
jgi:hypothetical protein